MSLLLAIDTSGKNGSLALARAKSGESEIEVLEVVGLAGGAFSAQLVPEVAALLENHGYGRRDLGALAVVSGPGSFTGLRVGLAAVKALAEALQKPIIAISLLEAVACRGSARGCVLAVLDAGRGDVYVGDYEIDGEINPGDHNHGQVRGRVVMHSERLLSREEFVAAISDDVGNGAGDMRKSVVTPDAALAEIFRAVRIEVSLIEYPNAGVIARLGWMRLQRGERVGAAELEANYIRRSDAEIFSKPVR
jgi:tRNA threonylcarbamoyladenosine biosynthesis protein TsaB